MWRALRPNARNLVLWQVLVLLLVFVVWHVLTKPGLIPPFLFENDRQAAFFFGEPLRVLARIWAWFFTTRDIYGHLFVTLVETVLAFLIGTAGGLGVGLWLALSPMAAAILDPYIKALNSMPRVILAPIFAVCCAMSICPARQVGCSPPCTRRSDLHSSARSSASTSDPRAAWAISSCRRKGPSTSTP